MAPLNSSSSKSPIWTRDRVSNPSRSHFSPGLKLILRTQVTNPEHGRFQSLSKGVYGTYINVVNSVYSKTSINGGGRAADSPPFPSYDFNYYSPTISILIWNTMCIVYSNSVTMPFCRLHLIV